MGLHVTRESRCQMQRDTRLLMRIDSRLNDRRYEIIFKPKTYNTSASMEDLFRRILGEKSGERKKVVVIDLSPVPFDVRSSIISLILRCLFDFSYWHRRVFGTRFPIAVFADEAHIYLNDEGSSRKPRGTPRENCQGRPKVWHQPYRHKSATPRSVGNHSVTMQ